MNAWLKTLLLFAAIAGAGHFIAYRIIHVPPQAEMVLIIAAALFYPILRYPHLGLYAVFLILPVIPFARKLYYLAYSRPTLDPLIVLGDYIMVVMLLGLFFEFRERMHKDRDISRYRWAVFLYLMYLVSRTFVLTELPLSESLARFKFYGPPVLFFFIGNVYAYSSVRIRRIWFISMLVSVFAALYGIKQVHFGFSKAEQLWIEAVQFTSLFIGGMARPFSLFQAPVAFADYALIGMVAVLAFLGWSKNSWRWLAAAFLPLLFYATLITSVRSSWIGVILLFLVWFLFSKVKGTRNRVLVIVCIILGNMTYEFFMASFGEGLGAQRLFDLVLKIAPNRQNVQMLVSDRAEAIYNPLEEYSFLSRIVLWRYILHSSLDPVLAVMGRGLGALKADSLYFTYLAEFGYPGLFFIVLLLWHFIRRGIRTIDTSRDRYTVTLAKAITAMNISFAVMSITGTHIHYFPGDIYFWFFNGVLVKISVPSIGSIPEEAETASEETRQEPVHQPGNACKV